MASAMRITVFGAGAIGGAVAFALGRAGFAPTLVARSDNLAAIRRHGLRVERPQGGGTVHLAATDGPAALGPQDLVIGTMKAQDWPAALPSLAPLVGPETALVPALNGVPWWYFDGIGGPLAGERVAAVDPDGALFAAFPARSVIGAVVYMGATRLGPGVVDWSSGNRFILGEAAGIPRERTKRAAEILAAAGFAVTLAEDIRREIWAKLLGNAPFNPLSVIARARLDDIMDDQGLAAIALASMREVAAVATTLGAPPSMGVEERFAINRDLGRFRTSMLQDYEAGRTLELGALVDAVTEIGGRLGVPTPMTAALGALARRAAALRKAVSGR